MQALDDPNTVVTAAIYGFGALGDPRGVPKLAHPLQFDGIGVSAAHSLKSLGDTGKTALEMAVASGPPMAQAHAIDALADLGDKSHLDLLRRLAHDEDGTVRAAAVYGLNDYLPESLPDLQAAENDGDPRVTRWARLGGLPKAR